MPTSLHLHPCTSSQPFTPLHPAPLFTLRPSSPVHLQPALRPSSACAPLSHSSPSPPLPIKTAMMTKSAWQQSGANGSQMQPHSLHSFSSARESMLPSRMELPKTCMCLPRTPRLSQATCKHLEVSSAGKNLALHVQVLPLMHTHACSRNKSNWHKHSPRLAPGVHAHAQTSTKHQQKLS